MSAPIVVQSSVKVKGEIKEFCNFVIIPKNEVAKLNTMYQRIETLCKEKGVNVTQMCRDAGVPRGNLTELKMGRTIALSAKTLDKISKYFGVSVDQLLGNEDAKKPADQKASGLRGTGYELLNEENRAVIDALIEKLYKSQFGE